MTSALCGVLMFQSGTAGELAELVQKTVAEKAVVVENGQPVQDSKVGQCRTPNKEVTIVTRALPGL
jgi:hypothetical protein